MENQYFFDSLHLSKEQRLLVLLPPNEKIVGSCEIEKFNDVNKCQMRVFLLTDKSVYNLYRSENFIKSMMSKLVTFQTKFVIRSRIPLESIEAITMNNQDQNGQFVLHMLNDHDYRFRLTDIKIRNNLIKTLCKQFQKVTKKKMGLYFKDDLTLIDYCTIKQDVKSKRNKKPKENPIYLNIQDLIDFELPGVKFELVYSFNEMHVPISKFKSSSLERMKENREYFSIQTKRQHFEDFKPYFENSHPFLGLPSYCFSTSQTLYFLRPLCIGGKLHKIIKASGPLKQQLAMFYCAQIILVLEYLHAYQWAYRSLCLESIFIKNNGYIALDGLGTQMRKKSRPDEVFYDLCGIQNSMAPEVILMTGHNQSVDIWNFAICAYMMLLGKHPFAETNAKTTMKNILDGKIGSASNLPDFVSRILSSTSRDRMSFTQIKNDKWFAGINWEKLESQEIVAPFIPELSSVMVWDGRIPSILYLDNNQ